MSTKGKKKGAKAEVKSREKSTESLTGLTKEDGTEDVTMDPNAVHSEVADNEPLDSESPAVLSDLIDPNGTLVVENDLAPPPPAPELPLRDIVIGSLEETDVSGTYRVTFHNGNVYTGNIISGKLDGEGEMIWGDGLEYRGEFRLNQLSGVGQYRWADGSTYEGELLNGIRHGKGLYVAADGVRRYEGEWWQGQRHGLGRMQLGEECFYEGQWFRNKKHGWGTYRYESGNEYVGQWVEDVRHGEGTMHWSSDNQSYTGRWNGGVQHGLGTHTWQLRRVPGSQYALRNYYRGEFVRGRRDGYGTFVYASGAKYEGWWSENLKHGEGTFTFKNGRLYRGMFDHDRIKEFPNFTIDGMMTPDPEQVRTRTPDCEGSTHSNVSFNTLSPSVQLDLTHLDFPAGVDSADESTDCLVVLLRHMTELRHIYTFYAGLWDQSTDNATVLTRLLWQRWAKDCKLHSNVFTLPQLDRVVNRKIPADEKRDHEPGGKILFLDFIHHIVSVAFHQVYLPEIRDLEEDEDEEPISGIYKTFPVLAQAVEKLISENILPNSCNVSGVVFPDAAKREIASTYCGRLLKMYNAAVAEAAPCRFTHRGLLLLLDRLRLLDGEVLHATAFCAVASSDNPFVADDSGMINLELECSFLEMLEIVIGLAEIAAGTPVAEVGSDGRQTAQSHATQVLEMGDTATAHQQLIAVWTNGVHDFLADKLLTGHDNYMDTLAVARLQLEQEAAAREDICAPVVTADPDNDGADSDIGSDALSTGEGADQTVDHATLMTMTDSTQS